MEKRGEGQRMQNEREDPYFSVDRNPESLKLTHEDLERLGILAPTYPPEQAPESTLQQGVHRYTGRHRKV